MSSTLKKSISGSVFDVLSTTEIPDTFGAQIIDVLFFDAEGVEVTPESGSYSILATPNKKDLIPFSGVKFPTACDTPIGDWQYGGYIDAIEAIPSNIVGAETWEVRFRIHGSGKPSDTSSESSPNTYFNAKNVVAYSSIESAVFGGELISTSKLVSVPANSSVSISFEENALTTVCYVEADGLHVSYVKGVASGDLLYSSDALSLNQAIEPTFSSSFEYYGEAAVGDRVATRKNEITFPFVSSNEGVIELTNLTSETISTYFSCGLSLLSEAFEVVGLLPDTLLTATTEMSDYNDAN